jgi:hypothetical protein
MAFPLLSRVIVFPYPSELLRVVLPLLSWQVVLPYPSDVHPLSAAALKEMASREAVRVKLNIGLFSMVARFSVGRVILRRLLSLKLHSSNVVAEGF